MTPKFLLRRALFAVALLLLPGAVSAQEGLLINPAHVIFEDRERVKTITLVNRSIRPQLYRMEMVNHRQLPNGQRVAIDEPMEGEHFAEPYIRFSPRQILLPPGEPQRVRFMLRAPGDLKDGEYRSHIQLMRLPDPEDETVESPDDAVGINLQAIYGVTLPVIFQRGDLSVTGYIDAQAAQRNEDGSAYIPLKVWGEGNRHLRADIFLVEDGEDIGRRSGIAVYVSTPFREFSVPVPEGATGQLSFELRDTETGEVIARSDVPAG